ncbi:MAG: hypothetical protein JNK90_03315 [Planctomycetaceae bacterium]|nr:hypothetical protein [Planctomycetaceae bacterium]
MTGQVILLVGIGLVPNPDLNAHIHDGEGESLVPLKLHPIRIESSLQLEHAKVTHNYFPGAGHGFLGTDS